MSTKNDVTGDNLTSKALSAKGQDQHCIIFCKTKCGSPVTCKRTGRAIPRTLKGDK